MPAPLHLFLVSELFYPDLPGGLMRYFRYGPGMAERGITMHVVTLRHQPQLADEEQVNSICIHRLDPPPDLPTKFLRVWLLKATLARALTVRATGTAAVIQPSCIFRQMAPTLWQARRHGIGVVFNLGITPEGTFALGIRGLLRRVAALPECSALSKVVFLSHQLERQFRPVFPLRASQKIVIPNGVDTNRFRPAPSQEERAELRSALGIRPDQKAVLFVGGIMPRKGVDILLRAWDRVQQEHPDAVLLLLGSAGLRPSHDRHGLRDELTHYLDQVQDLRNQLQEPANVRLLGEQPDPLPYYQAADLFAFPSHREGMPNAVLEAMATALPCLVARFDGMPLDGEEMGQAGVHFLSLGHAVEEWSELMTALLRDDQAAKRKELGRCAQEWIVTHQNLSKVLDRWAELCRSL
jgi:glycosyltransferase involved in cell wall biosynthesis